MNIWQKEISVSTKGKATTEITDIVQGCLVESGFEMGIVHVFCQHTSCSMVLMENADPSARYDLEGWLDRLVDEEDPHFTHTYEGPDDMPSHIKMALTRTSESIPFRSKRLMLGTWQGIFLWEHRARSHKRCLVISIQGE